METFLEKTTLQHSSMITQEKRLGVHFDGDSIEFVTKFRK
jgi:hypothetical protein